MPESTAENGNEVGPGAAGDDAGQGRLAAAGGAPEDDRAELVPLDGATQRRPRADDLPLSDESRPGSRAACGRRGERPRRAASEISRSNSPTGRGAAYRVEGLTVRLRIVVARDLVDQEQPGHDDRAGDGPLGPRSSSWPLFCWPVLGRGGLQGQGESGSFEPLCSSSAVGGEERDVAGSRRPGCRFPPGA